MMTIAQRILGGSVLVCAVAFCGYGFKAATEYPEFSNRWPWQAGFGTVGLACSGAALLCIGGSRMSENRALIAGICAGMVATLCVGLVLQRQGHAYLSVGGGTLAGILVAIATTIILSRDTR